MVVSAIADRRECSDDRGTQDQKRFLADICLHDLLQTLAEDLGPQSCGYIAVCAFGFWVVQERCAS